MKPPLIHDKVVPLTCLICGFFGNRFNCSLEGGV